MPNERVVNIDIGSEIDRFFDDSSIPHGEGPKIVILMGGPASGKTTIRKPRYSTGYVLVDAAEILLNLSGDEVFAFPEAFERPMEIIGSLVARRAVSERRNIVTELIGSDYEPTKALIEAFRAIGYHTNIQAITCDIEEAQRRNVAREDDCISAYYAEPYQRRWLNEDDSDDEEDAPIASIVEHADPLMIVVGRREVAQYDLRAPLATLKHLTSSLDMVRQFRERVDISFDGYNDTPNELWEIPEVRNYVCALDEQFPSGSTFYRASIPDCNASDFVCCPRSSPRRRALVSMPHGWPTFYPDGGNRHLRTCAVPQVSILPLPTNCFGAPLNTSNLALHETTGNEQPTGFDSHQPLTI